MPHTFECPESELEKPSWLRRSRATSDEYNHVAAAVRDHGLHTVCSEARCPNRTECWSRGTATFLILGSICTRGCSFCAVTRGISGDSTDPDEALRVAAAAKRMNLRHAVVTSVTRDDLPDGGATQFAATVRALKNIAEMRVEVLTPDYLDSDLETVLAQNPDVFAHNVETVPRLSPDLRHPRFSFARSLLTLRGAKMSKPSVATKSSLLLGMGETTGEVEETIKILRDADVDLLALGQYLRPTVRHAPVREYVTPEMFAHYKDMALEAGFRGVAAGPLVRTSYRASNLLTLHELSTDNIA